MKARPIPFSGEMIQALLAGRKTMDRRVVKPQPREDCGTIRVGRYHPTVTDRSGEEQPGAEVFGASNEWGDWAAKCPYGQPGDLLWCKEAWRVGKGCDAWPGSALILPSVHYEADPYPPTWELGRYRQGRFMPRWASRLTLRLTDVRVERLREISEEDAVAEGLAPGEVLTASDVMALPPGADRELARLLVGGHASAKLNFAMLWYEIHGARGPESWESNPWVWALRFDVLHANVDDVMREAA